MFIGIYFSSMSIRSSEEENYLFLPFAHFTVEMSFSYCCVVLLRQNITNSLPIILLIFFPVYCFSYNFTYGAFAV